MSEFSCIALTDAKQMVDAGEAVIADIRDPQSFAAGHLAGAINLTNDNVPEFIERAAGKPVLVFCYHGVSSQGAGRYLAEQGLNPVHSVDGGMVAWAQHFPDDLEQSV
ncbi:MAG: thiosulfate sulfurtransferase GlpE [Idiomarina sp.]|nr:thiosulfate sulfurtransferase GlpE [Idiomarina sp.]